MCTLNRKHPYIELAVASLGFSARFKLMLGKGKNNYRSISQIRCKKNLSFVRDNIKLRNMV